MSLTNPNTVVTEQRLSEFYQGILPYLGGMPEMLANKFSKGDLYSTEEKMIGQWIDGKPLYQKTVQIPSSAISSHSFVDSDLTNADTKLIVSGYYYTTDIVMSLNQCEVAENTTYYTRTGFRKSDNSLYLYVVGYNNVQGAVVTIQYTKTTDSAISIGSDTDYSTEEKIVSTWIDGRPIYQKTITGLNIKFNWVSTQVTMATNVDALIDDVDTIIKVPHAIMENNSGTQTTCNVDIQIQGTKWNLVSVEDYYLKNITIQYTKTN